MKNRILSLFGLSEDQIFALYPYGSHVYGTAASTSDFDFIVVGENGWRENDFAVEKENLSLHFYDRESFQTQLDKHKIAALECWSLPDEKVLIGRGLFKFSLNIEKLRSSVSEKASHSWVKSKKKFEVEKDRNVYIAKKSLFHSLRIIDFGSQIALEGKIKNFSSSNEIWEDILTDPNENWDHYHEKYKGLYNSKMTEFRKIAPKKGK